MWKTVLQKSPLILKCRSRNALQKYRTFLSQAYYLNDSWKSRLESPLLQKVNLDELYYELDQTYQNTKNISAIDVDVFANAVKDEDHLGELRDLVYKLRMSADCLSMPKSTEHAVIRSFFEAGKHEDLLDLLDDRLNYGIFLEYYEANILMNKLIKDKNYACAARVAVQLMLQEELDHDLSVHLAALSCFLYVVNPTGWPEEPAPAPQPKEEIKVRVKFLRNPYFDDHFDLRNPNHIVGKTLTKLCSKTDNVLFQNLHVLGLVLHEKNDQALEALKNLNGIYKEIVPILEKDELLKDVVSSMKIIDENVQSELAVLIKEAFKNCGESDIKQQKEIYQRWDKERLDALEEQKQRLLRIQRLESIEKTRKDLQSQEQKLWFFENEDKIDLQIDSNKIYYRKRWFGKLKKPRKIDENYVPPEIVAKRHNN